MVKVKDKYIFTSNREDLKSYYTRGQVYIVLRVIKGSSDTQIIMSDNLNRELTWGSMNFIGHWKKADKRDKPTWL